MANPKYRYRIKRYLNSIPNIEASGKVEIPDTTYYGNLLVLTNAHNISYNPNERYTLAMVEKENERRGTVTILTGKNAGLVYNHVPYDGGNFHFNEYKGDTYFGLNFNREDEKKDTTDKNSMVIINTLFETVEKENEKAVRKAQNLAKEILYSRPEY